MGKAALGALSWRAGGNVPDAKLLAQTLASIVVARPKDAGGATTHLCLDKGSDNPTGCNATAA